MARDGRLACDTRISRACHCCRGRHRAEWFQSRAARSNSSPAGDQDQGHERKTKGSLSSHLTNMTNTARQKFRTSSATRRVYLDRR